MKNFTLIAVLLCITAISRPVYSQGNPEDQYKQMGGVVGLTELCLGTILPQCLICLITHLNLYVDFQIHL